MDTKRLMPFEHALELLLEKTTPRNIAESAPLFEALGRVAFEDVRALVDQPPFDRSPLDGYAVDHRDIACACREAPVTLRVAESLAAGDVPAGAISRGEAVRVMTGSLLPQNATCVVRQEDTDQGDAFKKGFVRIFRSHGEYENYCVRGEDFRCGQILTRRGDRLDGVRLGLLAGQGQSSVKLFPRPSICVLSTGSELLAAGTPPEPGKIYDGNGVTLASRAREVGARVVPGVILRDDPRELAGAMERFLPECDLLVSTGGVSVGAFDCMPQAGEMMGAGRLFHGLALKPGGAAMALEKDGKLLLCLSGNPFAAYATFELLAVPVLRKLAGETAHLPSKVKAVMADDFDKPSEIRRFLRARIEGERVFVPKKGHSPGMLSSLVNCNCLIDIPAGTPRLGRGETVEAVLFAPGR
ncbi:MAG: molybdopterin molybdotransferase MoeA [Synergistaceae bacterium]|nr:molybdopterin molybdotransferase MoeA [Synergistaceae bacterium]